ncbi:hypothetical protein ALC62_00664 [Cyphomyrmex costatus]|uniref:Uncharacterized protein n=1 Tax=Cyphomyrmex costatus TaxID=456900 RepID=A0A151IQP8_9HYME|nr:hypothetical protein ALC62_00664 [Cyphomyrmex costatus]
METHLVLDRRPCYSLVFGNRCFLAKTFVRRNRHGVIVADVVVAAAAAAIAARLSSLLFRAGDLERIADIGTKEIFGRYTGVMYRLASKERSRRQNPEDS